MKRILLAAALLFGVSLARADEIQLFTSLSTNGTFGCLQPDNTIGPCDLNAYRTASFQVTGVGGTALGVVSFQCRNTSTDPMTEVFSVTNPVVNQIGWIGAPVSGACQVVVTWSGGQPMKATLTRNK